jgi:hypothetical protein
VKGKLKLDSAAFVTICAGIALTVVANRNHIDFTAVAFASAAALLAFLLPGVALVGGYIAEGLKGACSTDAGRCRRVTKRQDESGCRRKGQVQGRRSEEDLYRAQGEHLRGVRQAL